MSDEPHTGFLSEKNVNLHKNYLKEERARYSILEKSFPGICGRSFSEIYNMRSLWRGEKKEILSSLSEVLIHELYFSSFTKRPLPCKEIKKYYTSEDDFLYRAWLLGREKQHGFLYFYRDRRGKPSFDCRDAPIDIYKSIEPILAVDLCEHAYFLDYGFERGEYLRRALGFLDISRLLGKS